MASSMTIVEFQQLIRDRYYKTDAARGAPATFLWFSEEVGELAQALGGFLCTSLDWHSHLACHHSSMASR